MATWHVRGQNIEFCDGGLEHMTRAMEIFGKRSSYLLRGSNCYFLNMKINKEEEIIWA